MKILINPTIVTLAGKTDRYGAYIEVKEKEDVIGRIDVLFSEPDTMLVMNHQGQNYSLKIPENSGMVDTLEQILNECNLSLGISLTLKESCEGCTCGGNCNERTDNSSLSTPTE